MDIGYADIASMLILLKSIIAKIVARRKEAKIKRRRNPKEISVCFFKSKGDSEEPPSHVFLLVLAVDAAVRLTPPCPWCTLILAVGWLECKSRTKNHPAR